MFHKALVGLMVVALVGLGWIAGRSQGADPDFELLVSAPSGATTIECVRGCELVWVERFSPDAERQDEFSYSCSGERCSSGRIGGWVAP
jgi:hypothetical protein